MTPIKCPACHAPIQVDLTQPAFTCNYCGVQSRNEFYRPPPAPSVVPVNPESSSGHTIPGKVVLLLFLFIVAAIGGTCLILYYITAPINTLEVGDQADHEDTRWYWRSGQPIIADVNQDGTEDIIGRIKGENTLFLVAISGSDFSVLWKAENLSEEAQPYAAGGQVFVAQSNLLTAYQQSSGAPSWQVRLPDKVTSVFATRELLRVFTLDKNWHTFHLSNGQGVANPQLSVAPEIAETDRERACLRPATAGLQENIWPGLAPRQSFCDLTKETNHLRPTGLPCHGPSGEAAEIGCTDPFGLAVATQTQGTPVPHLVGYERQSGQKRWSRPLIQGLAELTNEPKAAIRGDHAVLVFQTGSSTEISVEALSVNSGQTLWRTSIADHGVTGVRLGAQRAYVADSMRLHVFDLGRGTLLATLGYRIPTAMMNSTPR